MTVFLISYFRRDLQVREYYLNRSSFPTEESAKREIRLIKKSERVRYKSINRIKFKIEPREIKKFINRSIN